jgi:2-C-methyl-D-erythritol 4-phosphate cytidylyltransferase
MNRIIREHYPASKLPEDLRAGVDPTATVTVTIVEEEKRPEKVMSLDEIWALRTPPFRTAKEIDDALRRQRDEWDD